WVGGGGGKGGGEAWGGAAGRALRPEGPATGGASPSALTRRRGAPHGVMQSPGAGIVRAVMMGLSADLHVGDTDRDMYKDSLSTGERGRKSLPHYRTGERFEKRKVRGGGEGTFPIR